MSGTTHRIDEPRTGSARPDLPLAVVVSAGGIGAAVARRLGQTNRLLLVDRDQTTLDRVVGSLANDGYDASSVLCDITDPASVAAMAAVVASTGPLRVLAHVAGLSPSSGDWRAIMTVNLIGAELVANALRDHVVPTTAAVFVSSLAAHVLPEPPEDVVALLDDPLHPEFLDRLSEITEMSGVKAYILSKRALNRMCRRKAEEWGARGGRIVSLSPGPIASPMGAFENARSPIKAEQLRKNPLRREGTMLEIADAVEFLASDRASYITGTDLLVDGGASTAQPSQARRN